MSGRSDPDLDPAMPRRPSHFLRRDLPPPRRAAVHPGAAFSCAALSCAALFCGAPARADEPPARSPALVTASPAPASRVIDDVSPARASFTVDPIADGALLVGTGAFAGLLNLINGTGEVRPQQISPTFELSSLLAIDRGAISQSVDPNARSYSNVGLAAAVGYAILDPILSGAREHSVRTGIVDAVLYGEAMMMTWGVTNLAKIAVRRPRPQAYIDARANADNPDYSNANTDSSLSFFSGHASLTASVASTATYLAFARSPGTARPWLTLGAGTLLTTFVSVERVRAGAHFPTDVIAGALAGAGIGVLVAHDHRSEDDRPRRVWVGFAPEGGGGGSLQAGGVF
jgi:membrane-associated phospholipid phosphatase